MTSAVLLDTCAVVWLANGDALKPGALAAITEAGRGCDILVSPVSAWEIGMLSRARLNPAAMLRFLPDPKTWFARFMAGPGIRAASFDPAIAIDASHLPGSLHADPADRLLIATARHLGVPVVTRDRRICAYAADGHVSVVAC